MLLNSDLWISLRPEYIDALMLIICCKPSIERWCLLLISYTIFFNNIKSAFFLS
jgi:hypothetical protein